MKKKINVLLFAAVILMSGLFFSCEKDKDDDSVETGTISGVIINSQTGTGLAYVTVGFTTDASVTDIDDVDYSTVTDTDGDYILQDVPVGTYVCIIYADGYFVRVVADVTVATGMNEYSPQTLVQQPDEGSFRIILTWGETPLDLDSHLTGPSSDGVNSFHMFYMEQNPDVYIDLDVDDIHSYGPETTTIHTFVSGIYRFSVHNYSDQSETGGSGIAQSPAKVEIYDATGLINTFNAPVFTGSGNTWRVCEINASGSAVSVVPVNTYVSASSSSDASAF
jgi:hypothetical protein